MAKSPYPKGVLAVCSLLMTLVSSFPATSVVPGFKFDYPSSLCHAANTTSLGKLTYEEGRVFNGSGSGTADVWCPLGTDFVGYSDGTSNAVLYYRDNASSNLTCTHFWDERQDGTPLWSWTFTSSGASSVAKTWTVADVMEPVVKSWRCTLPASSNVSLISLSYSQAP